MAKRKNNKPQEKTFWEEFEARGLAAEGQDPKEIIGFISERNAQILGVFGIGNDELVSSAIDEAAIFFVRFSSIFGGNRKLLRQMEENWPQKPLLFRVAQESLGLDTWKPLPADLSKNVLVMADYIFQTREDRYLTVGGVDGPQQYFFPRAVPQRGLLNMEASIISVVLDAALDPQGSLIFRHGDGDKEKFTVEGVICRYGNFFPLPTQEMRAVSELMPNGEPREDPTATYRTPPLIFQPTNG